MPRDRPGGEAGRRGRLAGIGKKTALLVLSTAVCLLVVEVGFRLAGFKPIYDVYSKPDVFWRHDPVLGWSLEPGSEGEYVGPRPFPVQFRTKIRINSLGLRGGELPAVPPGGYRVLVLGDSQTAGFEVPEGQTYSAVLERELTSTGGQPVQVVNAGIRGYGTDQELLLYRQLQHRLRPHIVVLHETANDPEDNTTLHRMRRPFGKAAFALDATGELQTIGHPIPAYPLCSAYRVDASFERVRVDGARARAFCRIQTSLADHSALFSFITARIERNPRLVKALYGLGTATETPDTAAPADRSPAPPPGAGAAEVPGRDEPAADPEAPRAALDHRHRLTSALILALADEVRDSGARFLLVTDDAELRRLDQAAFAAAQVPVVLTDDARARDADAVIPHDGHMNEVGHRRLAQFLAPHVRALAPA